MSADTVLLALYFGLTLAVGLLGARRRKKGMEDYVLAGRTLTLPMFVATLVTTFYGGVLGVGEYSWTNGLSNWLVMGAPYYIFGAVYAFFFAGKIRVSQGLTIPDHLETAYGRPLALFAALLLFLMMCPSEDIVMLGTLLQWVTGISLKVCMVACAVGVLLYIYRGGLRSDVWTNELQFAVMFGGFAIIVPAAYFKLGGWSYLSHSLPPAHLSLSGGKSAGYLLTWYLIGLWTLVDPTFHQRVCAAEDPKTARNGILWSILFWAIFDFMTTTAGMYSRALLPNLDNPLLAYPMLAQRLLPPLARGLFLAGLASTIVASLDGAALVSAVSAAKDGAGRLARASEETSERWAKWAVAVAGVLGLSLALWLPSVVELWYAVGSTIVPALLLPLISVYFPKLRIAPAFALASGVCSWLLSTAWFAIGQLHAATPLGIEPMYPGLFVALGLWTCGLLWRKTDATHSASTAGLVS